LKSLHVVEFCYCSHKGPYVAVLIWALTLTLRDHAGSVEQAIELTHSV